MPLPVPRGRVLTAALALGGRDGGDARGGSGDQLVWRTGNALEEE